MILYDNDAHREEFMELVYDLLHDDGTNDRANQIIAMFDSVPEVEVEPLPPNDPLTLEELRGMNDADVWVAYPPSFDGEQLIMHALVEYDSESENVWFTNNLGGRSTFDEVSEDGGLAYRRRPEEGNP